MAEDVEVVGSSGNRNDLIERSPHVSNSNKKMGYRIPGTRKALSSWGNGSLMLWVKASYLTFNDLGQWQLVVYSLQKMILKIDIKHNTKLTIVSFW